MRKVLKLKVDGLAEKGRVEAIKRSLGLVANVTGVTADPDLGEIHVLGDTDEHLVVVHLANEGITAKPVHEVRHAL